MIVVDTSALLSILQGEAEASACFAILNAEPDVLMSAATLTEALIVAGRRNRGTAMAALIDDLGIEIVSVTPSAAKRAASAYARWGKGVHPARLNFGDCFSYELAQASGSPLLYVGSDFSQTDIASAPSA